MDKLSEARKKTDGPNIALASDRDEGKNEIGYIGNQKWFKIWNCIFLIRIFEERAKLLTNTCIQFGALNAKN